MTLGRPVLTDSMRKIISSLFDSSKSAPSSARPAAAAAASRAQAGSRSEDEIFIGRQPILNSEQKLIAYELLFRSSAQAGSAGVTDDVQATSRLLINTFNNFGVERVLGNKKAFINVSAGLLESDVLELLPADKVVLEILEGVEPTADVVARCQALKTKGYQFALDDFTYRREYEPLLGVASFVKFDLRTLGPARVGEQLALLRGRGLSFLAEKVETRAEFNACRTLLINHYQGYYFAKPETLSMKRLDPSSQMLLQLFGLVTSGADPEAIETGFRQDVALSYNLLRYMNSVGFGLLHKVETIRHALVILGNVKLARWLTLLLFSSSKSNPAPHALFRTALVRARLAELLGQARLRSTDHDYLFMCGMFSLLDAMLDAPLADSINNLNLPQAVSAALLQGDGPYAPYLALSRACEDGEPAGLRTLASSLGLNLTEVTRLQMEAMVWAESIAGAGGP